MGTCEIEDIVIDAGGITHDGMAVYAWPQDNTIRVKDSGGTYRPIDPDRTILPAAYQYGVTELSFGGGTWSLLIPMSTEQHPTTAIWFIRLPDGKIFQGVPPATTGPYTIDDLLTNEGWTAAAGISVSVPASYKGEVTLVQAAFLDLVFPTAFPSDKYDVLCSFQDDTAGGGVPGYSWTNRSMNGVRLLFTSPYSGILTYRLGATQ